MVAEICIYLHAFKSQSNNRRTPELTKAIRNLEKQGGKIQEIHEPTTYRKLNNNPTYRLRTINKLIKYSTIPYKDQMRILQTEALPSRLYGLPKVHKNSNFDTHRERTRITYLQPYKVPCHSLATAYRTRIILHQRLHALCGKNIRITITTRPPWISSRALMWIHCLQKCHFWNL